MKDMSIYEWLCRLNLQSYAAKLRKEYGVRRASDLKHIGEGDLLNIEMTALMDRKRVIGMISGNEECKQYFALQTRA